jgi:hypothetical protein
LMASTMLRTIALCSSDTADPPLDGSSYTPLCRNAV